MGGMFKKFNKIVYLCADKKSALLKFMQFLYLHTRI